MRRQFIANQWLSELSFLSVLKRVLGTASAVDMAVSYLKVSGWELLEGELSRMSAENVRMLVTDQFAFTHPEAVRKALTCGILLRNYIGSKVYHPKVYIAYNAARRPIAAVVGSANISDSGLRGGIEAGIVISDAEVLRGLKAWFDELFADRVNTSTIDEAQLKKMDRLWKDLATKRIEAERKIRGRRPRPAETNGPSPGDLDTLEDILSTVKLPIAILSIDQAGNNVRNLKRLLDVLQRYPKITGKERSELHLLGLMEGGDLTHIGNKARKCKTERHLAETWCGWVKVQKEVKLKAVNPRIANFRRAAEQFWKLRGKVRNFFLKNLRSKSHRKVLQAIELLCNGSDIVSNLSLSDFEALAPVIARSGKLEGLGPIVAYMENKGSRSWSEEDRKTILSAWQKVS